MCENIIFGLTSTISDGDLERVREFDKHFPRTFPKGDDLLVEAIQYGRRDIAELLLTHGYKVNCIYKKNDETRLHFAIARGYVEIVEMLLHRGADIHHKDKFDSSVLHTAVKAGNSKIVKLLLDHGADVHVVKSNGVNPLHLASTKQNVQIVEDLLNYGADINYVCTAAYRAGYFIPVQFSTEHGSEEDSTGYTPLHIAVKARRETVVKLLLERGAKVDAQDKSGNTVLHLAIEKGNSRIVDEVLKYCPDINNQCNRSSLKTAVCVSYFGSKNIENLLRYGFIVNPEDVDNFKFLHNAVGCGYLKIVKDLLKNGADVNMVGHSEIAKGLTLLHIAVMEKQEEVAKLLVNYGANVNAKDKWERTPVSFAVKNNDAKITRLLLTNGADIKDSPELLHEAAANGCLEIVEDLLKNGADVNMVYHSVIGESSTPLHSAVMAGQEEVAKLLVNYGANVNAKDKWERTPVYYAVLKRDAKITRLLLTNGADIKDSPELLHKAAADGCLEIVEDLLKNGADVNMVDHSEIGKGSTPLHIAVMEKQEEVAKLLVNYGANVNAKDTWERTPVFYAVKNNDAKITRLLLTNGADMKDSSKLLYLVAVSGNLEIVEDLLKNGADVNMVDHSEIQKGSTPLHIAVMEKQEEVAKLLVNCGANVNAKDKWKITPVYYAVLNRDAKITRLILTNGADIKDSPELLDKAVANGCLEIVEDLLNHGVDVNNNVPRYRTPPLHPMFHREYITPNSHAKVKIVKLLKKHVAKLQAAGLYVSERNLKFLIDDYEIFKFQRKCEREIEIMKREKISNSYVYFYDILTKNTLQLETYAKNESIVQAFKSADYKTKFPIYASIIEGKFRNGLKRHDLEELGNQLFHSLFKNLPELPLLCLEKIFSYLSNYDLKRWTFLSLTNAEDDVGADPGWIYAKEQ